MRADGKTELKSEIWDRAEKLRKYRKIFILINKNPIT
jgi:hypothetical protein